MLMGILAALGLGLVIVALAHWVFPRDIETTMQMAGLAAASLVASFLLIAKAVSRFRKARKAG